MEGVSMVQRAGKCWHRYPLSVPRLCLCVWSAQMLWQLYVHTACATRKCACVRQACSDVARVWQQISL
eukprot:4874670-Karenia_brevis.AAC.1